MSMTTRTAPSRSSEMICFAAASPSRFGIRMSISTTSGSRAGRPSPPPAHRRPPRRPLRCRPARRAARGTRRVPAPGRPRATGSRGARSRAGTPGGRRAARPGMAAGVRGSGAAGRMTSRSARTAAPAVARGVRSLRPWPAPEPRSVRRSPEEALTGLEHRPQLRRASSLLACLIAACNPVPACARSAAASPGRLVRRCTATGLDVRAWKCCRQAASCTPAPSAAVPRSRAAVSSARGAPARATSARREVASGLRPGGPLTVPPVSAIRRRSRPRR